MKKEDFLNNSSTWMKDGGYNFIVEEETFIGKVSFFAWWDKQKWRFCYLPQGKDDPSSESKELD
jgi:hypothetical protein